MNKQEACSAVEDNLQTLAHIYVEEGGSASLGPFVMTNWLGITAWSGMADDGSEASRIIVHLRDFQMPTWQTIGLLRAALVQFESHYFDA